MSGRESKSSATDFQGLEVSVAPSAAAASVVDHINEFCVQVLR